MCVLDSDASYSQYVYSERKHDVAAECSLKHSIFFKILYLLWMRLPFALNNWLHSEILLNLAKIKRSSKWVQVSRPGASWVFFLHDGWFISIMECCSFNNILSIGLAHFCSESPRTRYISLALASSDYPSCYYVGSRLPTFQALYSAFLSHCSYKFNIWTCLLHLVLPVSWDNHVSIFWTATIPIQEASNC